MARLVPKWSVVPGVVAVSGGADSVAMACLLAGRASDGVSAKPSLVRPANNLIVAHVNHQLRGDESDADEAFVMDLCQRLSIECRTARIPVSPGNLEAEARKSRYAFFQQLATETQAGWIATAHTLDDQAETVLHRLIRGTGIQGLRGIPDCRAGSRQRPEQLNQELRALTRPGSTVVRPLLDIRRAELRDYLASIQQPFREDSSNTHSRFTRNRIRHELLPMLETFNPQIAEVLSRLSHQAAEWHEFQELAAAELLKQIELPRAGTMLIFDAEKLEQLAEPQRRAVLRMAWQREGWPEQGMTFAHWSRLAELATSDFPGGVRSERRTRVFQLQGDSRRPAF